MLDTIWDFLRDEGNRAVLGWIGGGIVVVAGGIWAVIKYRTEPKAEHSAKQQPPSVSASHGGVAAGGDIKNSMIKTRGDAKG